MTRQSTPLTTPPRLQVQATRQGQKTQKTRNNQQQAQAQVVQVQLWVSIEQRKPLLATLAARQYPAAAPLTSAQVFSR
jgi:hypothetical protein